MGGFKPSRADIAGSTIVGSDLTVDTHQFTGSVDITGSLTLNGSSVTGGGGGGAVATYTNAGNDRVITSVNADTINGEANLTFDGTSLTSPQVTASVSMKAAILEVSSSAEGALFRVDHSTQVVPTLFVTGSGRVGIGTAAPETPLEILNTSTQQRWSYDADSFATLTVASDSDVTLATGENGDITLHAGPSGDIFLVADGGQVNFQNPAGQNKLAIDVENASGLAYISNVKNNDLIFRVGTGVKEIFRIDQSEGALLMSGNVDNPGGLAPINFRDTATNIHSPGANRLALTAPTLEISGSTRMSGAFGSTMVETITDHLQVSATTGLTIIDASSSLAVNNTLVCSIANGTFVGQQKNIRGMIVSGSTLAASTGILLTGSNIDTYGNFPLGTISLTGSNPGAGPLFQRAGCQLVWGGTKWLPVGNFNFNINGTGRLF